MFFAIAWLLCWIGSGMPVVDEWMIAAGVCLAIDLGRRGQEWL